MRLDLHVHSSASDGELPPEAVVARAAEGRLDVIALSDHDTTAGVPAAREAARAHRIHVIPAIEVTSTLGREELHFLGYFVDPEEPALVRHQDFARERREERMRGMVELLAEEGIDVEMDAVRAQAGSEETSLARPHLARALVEAGHASSVSRAFDRWIGGDGPAFLPTRLLEPAGAIGLIAAAGGVPVWAHPPMDRLDELLDAFVDAGLRGVEAHRPRNRRGEVRRLARAARSRGLLVTGGSDWHGSWSGELGSFYVTREEVAGLLDEGGL